MAFVYEIYKQASENGFIDFKASIPDYITQNLKFPLRPYQKEAVGRYLYYKRDEKNRKKTRTSPLQYGDRFRKNFADGSDYPENLNRVNGIFIFL